VDPSSNREYGFIDGLRGLAILMVLVCHSFYGKEPESLAGKFALHFAGEMGKGVNLFFTLSGFLISWPFWKRKVARAEVLVPPGYGWRRFWKIYPPLALSVLLLTPFYICCYGDAQVYLTAAAQWLSGLAFIMPVSGRFNPVMWSLVLEIHFYLVLPLLFLLSKPLSARASLWGISIFLFAVPVTIQALTGLAPTFGPEISDPLCTGLSSFCLGVAVAGIDALKIWNKSWSKIGPVGWLLMFIGLSGLAWGEINSSASPAILREVFHWIFVLGTGCLLCYAAAPEHPHARWLCAPWLRWCGIISYEWYLFHQPMIIGTRELLGPTSGNIIKYSAIIALPLAVSLAVAALIYRYFSLPILKYGRSKKAAAKHSTGH